MKKDRNSWTLLPHVPERPAPLLGRDLLSKLGAAIYLNKEKGEVLIPKDKGINAMAILHQAPKGQEPVPTGILDQVNQLFRHKEKYDFFRRTK